jgi:hypothetical protein
MTKRIIYTLAAPLVPFIRLRRIYCAAARTKHNHRQEFWRAFGYILIGLCAPASGEAVGYSFGQGEAQSIYVNFELYRRDFVRPEDRFLFQE